MGEDSHSSPGIGDRLDEGSGGQASGMLVLSDEVTNVGESVTLKGRNFPPDEQYTVRWHSVEGQWGVLEANEVVGPQYVPREEDIGTTTTDENGRFDEEWTVEQDYGGAHSIELLAADGAVVADAELTIEPHFELDRTTAPLGEAFRLTGYGLGPSVVQNNYQVSWDNGYVGFVTGVENRGTATADVRAVGPPGEHVIQLWRNYRGVPQVEATERSAYGPVDEDRGASWTVTVTEPEEPPEKAWVDGLLEETPIPLHYPDLDEDTDAELSVSPSSGQGGTAVTITGSGFPPEREVELVWHRHAGSYVQGIPVDTVPRWGILPTVTTDEDGAFETTATVPTAEGSTRPITAKLDGKMVAATGFVVQPSIESFTPRSGPAGTEIEIELAGLGWTMYENCYYVVYDNKPLGYVSGTSDDDAGATVRTVLKAVGEPGYHFVDIYPAIYEMQEDNPDFELHPHLSYLDNHPVRPMPGLHLTFEVTE